MGSFRKNFEDFTKPGLVFKEASRTKQSFKEECDINNILKRYVKTGVLPELIKSNPRYGDFSDVQSYQESLQTVILAQEQFNALPAELRDRFGNDPARFLEFVDDPKNGDELVDMGLATKRESEGSPKANTGVKDPVKETMTEGLDAVVGSDQDVRRTRQKL